ncbi:MAG TPA: hemolysin family protein [Solirubrobacterales bacterium]|nr:hemolysin family protein [Solirubrobacterales bacterium]
MSDLLRLLALLALVGANAFFVIGEYAVITARRGVLRERAAAGSAGAKTALTLMDDPVRVISTVQIGITAIGILSGSVGQPVVESILGDALPGWADFAIAFAIVTYLALVVGELAPKALTLARAESLAIRVAPPIALLARILRPVVAVLQGSARLLVRPFGVETVTVGDSIRSPQELREMIDEAEETGLIPRAQEELLHKVFEFSDKEAADAMVPAADVAWLDADLDVGAAIDRILTVRHARYPVGDGSLDRPLGLAYAIEIASAARADRTSRIRDLVHEALIVPENKDLGALLRELRERNQQLALVADEYGHTVGIVSLEDILEEIVGEIEGEFDLPDDRIEWRGDHTAVVAGSMTIDDFNETTGTHLPVGEERTIAGLVFSTLGHSPRVDDVVTVDSVRMTVESLDGLRIERVALELPDDRQPAGDPPG